MQKRSRAYEAGESLADMPIKKTKMSHKKCTPGEFGAAVKEAASLGRALKSIGGAVGGALTQGAPQAARKAMMGNRDSIGFVRDLGAAIGHPMQPNYVRNSLQQSGRAAFRGQVGSNAVNAAAAGVSGAGAGYGAKYLNAYLNEANKSPQTSPAQQPAARNMLDMIKTQSARDFGAVVKAAVSLTSEMPAPLLGSQTLGILRQAPSIFKSWVPASSAAGALVGAGIGATNDDGLLGGALRGGLIGAGAGFGGPLSAGAGVGVAEDLGSNNIAVPVGAGAAGAVGGGYAGNALYNALAGKKKKTKKRDKTKTKSARDFGAYVKQSFDIREYLPQSGLGAAGLGAAAAGLGTMLIPGEDEEGNGEHRYDSRIRRAILNAGLGGLAGAGVYYLPQLLGAGSSAQQAAPQSLATQSGQQSTVSPAGAAAATSQNRYGSLVPPAATASSPAAGASLDPATQNKIVQGLKGVGSGIDAAAALTNPGLLLGHAGASGLNALQQYGASLGQQTKAKPAGTKPFYSPDPAMREVMQRPQAGLKPTKPRRPFD